MIRMLHICQIECQIECQNICQVKCRKRSDRISGILSEYISKYTSWNVMVGITRSKVITFYLYIYIFYMFMLKSFYIILNFFWRFFLMILNVFDFWTNKTMLYLTPCGLQHYLVLLMKYFPFHLPWGLVGFFQWLLFPIKLMSDCFPAIFWCIF